MPLVIPSTAAEVLAGLSHSPRTPTPSPLPPSLPTRAVAPVLVLVFSTVSATCATVEVRVVSVSAVSLVAPPTSTGTQVPGKPNAVQT